MSGWASGTAGQAISRQARSKGRRSSAARGPSSCGGSLGRARRAPPGTASANKARTEAASASGSKSPLTTTSRLSGAYQRR